MRRLDPQWVASTDEILAQFPSWKNVPLFAPLEGVGTDQKALTEHLFIRVHLEIFIVCS